MKKLLPIIIKSICSIVFISSIVGCGGGSGDNPNPPVAYAVQETYTLSAENVNLAKAVGAALRDKSIALGADYANSQLTFTAIPAGAPADAISGVSIRNQYYEATGFAMAGSLKLLINNLIWFGTPNPNPSFWTPILSFTPLQPSLSFPFSFSFPSNNFILGPQIAGINVHIGPYSTSTDLPVTVSSTGSNTASIQIGNASVPVSKGGPAPTGATGSLN